VLEMCPAAARNMEKVLGRVCPRPGCVGAITGLKGLKDSVAFREGNFGKKGGGDNGSDRDTKMKKGQKFSGASAKATPGERWKNGIKDTSTALDPDVAGEDDESHKDHHDKLQLNTWLERKEDRKVSQSLFRDCWCVCNTFTCLLLHTTELHTIFCADRMHTLIHIHTLQHTRTHTHTHTYTRALSLSVSLSLFLSQALSVSLSLSLCLSFSYSLTHWHVHIHSLVLKQIRMDVRYTIVKWLTMSKTTLRTRPMTCPQPERWIKVTSVFKLVPRLSPSLPRRSRIKKDFCQRCNCAFL